MAADKDRISKYLIKLNEHVLFDELSDDYLKRAGVYDQLHGVPVPIIVGMGGDELSTLTIALGMARIIGADNGFRYRDNYLEAIDKLFGSEFVKVLISEGAKLASRGDYEIAAMLFRTALIMDSHSRDALYLYGRACKDAYEIETSDEEYVGNYKAESIDAFELLTMMHPDFAMGHYFLGYGYANLGLYTKADLEWKEFMELTDSEPEAYDDLREEIGERRAALIEPVRIERACNMILSGDYLKGREELSKYKEGRYNQWWPLWYHLGIAESALGNPSAAVDAFKIALKYSPSNTDVMRELVEVYSAVGDIENAEKYRRKIQVVYENIESERAQ